MAEFSKELTMVTQKYIVHGTSLYKTICHADAYLLLEADALEVYAFDEHGSLDAPELNEDGQFKADDIYIDCGLVDNIKKVVCPPKRSDRVVDYYNELKKIHPCCEGNFLFEKVAVKYGISINYVKWYIDGSNA